MIVGWVAVFMSLGLFVIYLPGSPSALIWPWEWAMVLGWALLGAVFYALARREQASE